MSCVRTLRWSSLTVIAAFLLGACTSSAQQTYVTRYDAFAGYNYLNSSGIGLSEPGFGLQVGFRPTTWYSIGFDYTKSEGDLRITQGLLVKDLQDRLAAQLAQLAALGRLPAGYTPIVPANSKTQTFAIGPQLAYRHFRRTTLFLRPVFAGIIKESARLKPPAGDLIAAGIVRQLAPDPKITDKTWFLGFGGGFDVIGSNHFALRVQADLVYDHLFPDLLRNGRWTTRFAIGPAFNFGKNIAKVE